MKRFLDRIFRLEESGTTIRTEAVGGVTTFMTMSYIIFVQPVILSGAGMDKGAVMFATCVASALATLLMGLLARYPISLAPAMGHNVFFAVIVCGTMGYSWQIALGAVFISGLIFIILSAVGAWEKLVASVPNSLKHAIAVGIGLLIALVGLQWGGVVIPGEGTIAAIGNLTSKPVLVVLFGVAVTAVLMALRVRGAILLGILATALLGLPAGLVQYHGVFSMPPSVSPTLFKLDILGALDTGLITVIFVFFFLDMFDTMGTLIGVSGPAGFLEGDRLPRANRAMFADAVGTVGGALLGTSTITSYVESASGIEHGAKTGLANVFTSLLFLVALFFSPLAEMFGGEYVITLPAGTGNEAAVKEIILRPVIAPALIIVGYLMLKCVSMIRWDEITEAIPAYLTIIMMPLSGITDGIAFGFISFALLKLVTGKGKDVHWLIYMFAVLFIVKYIVS